MALATAVTLACPEASVVAEVADRVAEAPEAGAEDISKNLTKFPIGPYLASRIEFQCST